MKPGVPDLHLPIARGKYIGMYIEMKVSPNTCTEKQLLWMAALRAEGHYCVVAYSWHEAREQIVAYMEERV